MGGREAIRRAYRVVGTSNESCQTGEGLVRFGAGRMVVFCFVCAVLLGWQFYHAVRGEHWSRPPLPHGDGPDYESIATSLSEGSGYQFAWQSQEWRKPYRDDPDWDSYSQLYRRDWPGPTAARPPLYPSVIAVIYSYIPRGPVAFSVVRAFSVFCTALAGALAVSMAFEIATEIGLSRLAAMVASISTLALALLDRTIRTYSVDFLTEPFAMLLCMVIAWGLMKWQKGNGTWVWFLTLILGTSALIALRSIAIFWLPGLALLIAATTRVNRARWACVYVVAVVLIMTPWWIRNCVVLQRFMPLGGQGAASLCGGYCDEAFSDWGNWHGDVEERLQRELDRVPGSEGWTQAEREVALASRASSETWTWISAHPQKLLALMAMRVVSHWSPFTGASLLWRLAIAAGWIGLAWMRRREWVWMIGLPLISTATVSILYETGGRFLVPLYGLLYLTAGLGVAIVAARWTNAWFALRRLFRF